MNAITGRTAPMTAADISTVVLAAAALLGLIVAVGKWFFARGGSEKAIVIAMNENTRATGELTTAFHSFRTETLREFRTLDVRVTQLEANHNGNSAHRNLGTPGGHN
jgi:hypothetical protein